MNVKKIREDFPILKRTVKGKKLVYLDNAATSQKPKQVIEAVNNYYREYNANIHRGVHKLSEEATSAYEEAHQKVANLINSKFEETVFTSGTTESLNMVAHIVKRELNKGDEIVLTQTEHHSNIVPWQIVAKEKGVKIRFIKLGEEGKLDIDQFSEFMSKKVKIVSTIHMSNVLGTTNPVKEIGKIAHENKALFVVDAAQSVPHMPVDVKKMNCDFMAFSGHKMLAPTGTGVLYGKRYLLEKFPPFLTGGDMIREVSFKNSTWSDLPWKYEAGTPNIAGSIGFGVAVDYLKKIGLKNIQEYEEKLSKQVIKTLENIENLELYGSTRNKRAVFSFNLKGIHAHDVSSLLDDFGIAIRGGHHCAMPLMRVLKINGSARASFYIYNTKEEIELLMEGLEKIKKIFV